MEKTKVFKNRIKIKQEVCLIQEIQQLQMICTNKLHKR